MNQKYRLSKTGYINRDKDIQVLKIVGDKREILRLCNDSKDKLRNLICKLIFL